LKGGVAGLAHSVSDSFEKQAVQRADLKDAVGEFTKSGQGLNKQILAATGIAGIYKGMADDGAIPDYKDKVSDAWKSIQGDPTKKQEKEKKEKEAIEAAMQQGRAFSKALGLGQHLDEKGLEKETKGIDKTTGGIKAAEVKINAEKATTTTSGGASVAGAGGVHTPVASGDASSLDAHIEGPVGVENAGSSLDFSLDNEDMARLIGSINSTDASIATRLQALAASNLYVAEKINEMKREVVNSVQQNKEATNKVADAVKNITGSDTSGNGK
ncbi:MAG: hypothetical protein J6C13_04580, partial [Clostridia bacterium]|nr:hypothetical protein [Clostridia bacterium]